MKRTLAILAVLIIAAGASAQESGNLRIGLGGYPLIESIMTNGFGCNCALWSGPEDLESIYRDFNGNSYSTGAISAEYAWDVKKWFTCSLSAATNVFWTNRYDAISGQKTGADTGVVIHTMATARFKWVSREIVRMYSSIGLGLISAYGEGEAYIFPGVQFCPIGIEVGKDIFGFCEIGAGTTFLGAMAGIGFRF